MKRFTTVTNQLTVEEIKTVLRRYVGVEQVARVEFEVLGDSLMSASVSSKTENVVPLANSEGERSWTCAAT